MSIAEQYKTKRISQRPHFGLTSSAQTGATRPEFSGVRVLRFLSPFASGMWKFYKAGQVRMVTFTSSGKYYVTAIRNTRFTDFQLEHAAHVGTLGTRQPRQLTFASSRKRSRFLRKIRADIDWVQMWWWYIG